MVAEVAKINVLRTDSKVFLSLKSSSYHFNENPENTDKLFASLKEKTNNTKIGAKRNAKISPLYILDANYIIGHLRTYNVQLHILQLPYLQEE